MVRMALFSALIFANIGPVLAGDRCATLADEWDSALKNRAQIFASSIGDNSAARATVRALENLAELSAQGLILDIMKNEGCPMPVQVHAPAGYVLGAMDCETARLKHGKAECDRTEWKADH